MIKITVMRMARYDDLSARYENPIQHACDMYIPVPNHVRTL